MNEPQPTTHHQPVDSHEEDRFADALDAMVIGMPWAQFNSTPLAHAAAAIHETGAIASAMSNTSAAPRLERSEKRRIWSDLMGETTALSTPESEPRTPGSAGSAMALNPWVAESAAAKPKRARVPRGCCDSFPICNRPAPS